MSKQGLRHYNLDGTPKRSYTHMGWARSAQTKLQKKELAHIAIYRCPTCKLFHLGKDNFTHESWVREKQSRATDERLVGQLIGILRGTWKYPTTPQSK